MSSRPSPSPKRDGMAIPTAPLAQAAHPFLSTKLLPEKPKSTATLFYEDECSTLSDTLFRNDAAPQERIKAALSLGDTLRMISDEKMISDAVYLLKETMLDDSEQTSLRMACAVSLGSSGIKDFIQEMENALKSDESNHSKILVLKALSICRSDEAIELLANVALYGDIDQVCIAAAKELLNIPLYQAQKIVRQILSNPSEAYTRNPDFLVEFRRLAEGCYLPTN